MGSRYGEASFVRIAIVIGCVPFAAGRAEYLADTLKAKLIEAGHDAIVVAIPVRQRPPLKVIDDIVACRSLRLPNTDLMIGLNHPAYYLPHANKVIWSIDYFCNGSSSLRASSERAMPGAKDQQVHLALNNAERTYLRESRRIYADS